MFEIIPAIDLRDGKCVRLTQGDYAQTTVYGDDPAATALRWQSLGAPRIHVVDLDGAAAGHPTQLEVVRAIASRVTVPVQLGGGLRSIESVTAAFAAGVSDVILGTAAIENPSFLDECLAMYPGRVIVGLDARNGQVAVRGWLEQTTITVLDLTRTLEVRGADRIVFTDIARDGMLEGPNLSSLREVVESTPLRVIASGGVSTVEQVLDVQSLGAAGAIIGKALYVGTFDLPTGLARAAAHAQ